MEFLPYNLKEEHDRLPFTHSESTTACRQGFEGLNYLHSQGVSHRDIKPENVLLSSRKPLLIKIADFGLASNAESHATFCGNWQYSAPEIFFSFKYNSKVDIWAWGLVTFELLHGLPKRTASPKQEKWFERLFTWIKDKEGSYMVDFLSTNVLRSNPRDRLSAEECLDLCDRRLYSPSATPTEALSPGVYQRNKPATGVSHFSHGKSPALQSLEIVLTYWVDSDQETQIELQRATFSFDLHQRAIKPLEPISGSRSKCHYLRSTRDDDFERQSHLEAMPEASIRRNKSSPPLKPPSRHSPAASLQDPLPSVSQSIRSNVWRSFFPMSADFDNTLSHCLTELPSHDPNCKSPIPESSRLYTSN